MKKIQITFGFILLVFSIFAQNNLKHATYSWEVNPKIHQLDEKYEKESAVVILDNRIIEMDISSNAQNTFKTIHKIIRTNTDIGVEKHNKIYIPVQTSEAIIGLKVRIISADGTVNSYMINSLKKLENVNGFSNYQIYAIEGVEKGAEIEFIYTIKQNIRSYGREIFQTNDPIIKARFELSSTKNFSYSYKAYNTNSITKSKEKQVFEAKDVPAITDEGYSNYKSKLMRVDYRLERTPFKFNVMNWNNISNNISKNVDGSKYFSKSKKFLKSLNLNNQSDEEKIKIIEKEFKDNYTLKESGNEDYGEVKFIHKNKVGNSIGITRAYANCFRLLEIPFEVIATSSRFNGNIDKNYATYLDLRTILFYFPDIDKYLSPEYLHLRLGAAPPSAYQGNEALAFSINNTNFISNQIRTLPILKAEHNNTGVKAKLSLNDALNSVDMEIEQFFQGSRAALYKYYYKSDKEEGIKMLKNDVISSAIEDPVYSDFTVENEAIESTNDFKIKGKLSSQSMVQSAGNDLLISIGKVIGKQNELYEEQERVSDVILNQAIRYTHHITMEIPEGYTVKGLEPLVVDHKVTQGGELLMRFLSNYTLENNLLTITINEDYEVLEMDKSKYKDYQLVVNSAANFNKIVLVLTKE